MRSLDYILQANSTSYLREATLAPCVRELETEAERPIQEFGQGQQGPSWNIRDALILQRHVSGLLPVLGHVQSSGGRVAGQKVGSLSGG